ncbi:predicted protein [Coccidioides posadasii str. Silveira]|uniref:Predicted protein n=1 Tax=Coccidioides posadasii (strain RMSCC 757 / Silveira) TaxID=443226 RepID=E9DJK2_COCPS|nr:predicted protein [Coccidioides posadasii str. Silveira]
MTATRSTPGEWWPKWRGISFPSNIPLDLPFANFPSILSWRSKAGAFTVAIPSLLSKLYIPAKECPKAFNYRKKENSSCWLGTLDAQFFKVMHDHAHNLLSSAPGNIKLNHGQWFSLPTRASRSSTDSAGAAAAAPKFLAEGTRVLCRPYYMELGTSEEEAEIYKNGFPRPLGSHHRDSTSSIPFAVDRMSASSGVNGWCDVCRHPNNEHNYYTCTATGCRKKFKICQTGSHVEFNMDMNMCCASGALIIPTAPLTTSPICPGYTNNKTSRYRCR